MSDWWSTKNIGLAGLLLGLAGLLFAIFVFWQDNTIVLPTNIGGHIAPTRDGGSIDAHSDRESTSPTKEANQSTSGHGSPAINDTDGNVIINITSPNVK